MPSKVSEHFSVGERLSASTWDIEVPARYFTSKSNSCRKSNYWVICGFVVFIPFIYTNAWQFVTTVTCIPKIKDLIQFRDHTMAINSYLLEWYLLPASLMFLLKQCTKWKLLVSSRCNNIPASPRLDAYLCNSIGLVASNSFNTGSPIKLFLICSYTSYWVLPYLNGTSFFVNSVISHDFSVNFGTNLRQKTSQSHETANFVFILWNNKFFNCLKFRDPWS